MPPNKKRQAKRFFFDSEKYPKFPKIVHRLRKVIAEQRKEYKELCTKEWQCRRLLRSQLNGRRQKFIIPQNEEERQIRLAGVDMQLKAKHEIRKTLMYALGKVDRHLRENHLASVCKLVADDRKEEGRFHYEHAINQNSEIAELHERMTNLIQNSENRPSKINCKDTKSNILNPMASDAGPKGLECLSSLESNACKISSASTLNNTGTLSNGKSDFDFQLENQSMSRSRGRNTSNRSIFDLIGSMSGLQHSPPVPLNSKKKVSNYQEVLSQSISMPPPDPLPSSYTVDKRI